MVAPQKSSSVTYTRICTKACVSVRVCCAQLHGQAQGGAAIWLPSPIWDRQGLLQRRHADGLQEGGQLQVCDALHMNVPQPILLHSTNTHMHACFDAHRCGDEYDNEWIRWRHPCTCPLESLEDFESMLAQQRSQVTCPLPAWPQLVVPCALNILTCSTLLCPSLHRRARALRSARRMERSRWARRGRKNKSGCSPL